MVYTGILAPGTCFEVTGLIKNSVMKPATMGFFSHYRRNLSGNGLSAESKVVVIRRGKSGKLRLDYHLLTFPTLFTEDVGFRRYYKQKSEDIRYNLVMKAVQMEETFMENIDTVRFLGWALSKVMFLRYIDRQFMQYSFWSKDRKSDLNVFKDVISQRGSEMLNDFVDMYTDPAARVRAVRVIRNVEAMFSKPILAYNGIIIGHVKRCFNTHITAFHANNAIENFEEMKKIAYSEGPYV